MDIGVSSVLRSGSGMTERVISEQVWHDGRIGGGEMGAK